MSSNHYCCCFILLRESFLTQPVVGLQITHFQLQHSLILLSIHEGRRKSAYSSFNLRKALNSSKPIFSSSMQPLHPHIWTKSSIKTHIKHLDDKHSIESSNMKYIRNTLLNYSWYANKWRVFNLVGSSFLPTDCLD